MGLVLIKNAWWCSLATAASLYFGLPPLYAFLIGVVSFFPFRIFFRTNLVSQTGLAASGGAVLMNWLGFGFTQQFLVGTALGYFYVYWWLFIYPRISLGKSVLKTDSVI